MLVAEDLMPLRRLHPHSGCVLAHTRAKLGACTVYAVECGVGRKLHKDARAAQMGRNTWATVALATPHCGAETGAESSRLDDVPCKTSTIASHTNVHTLADRTKRRRFGSGVS